MAGCTAGGGAEWWGDVGLVEGGDAGEGGDEGEGGEAGVRARSELTAWAEGRWRGCEFVLVPWRQSGRSVCV